MCRAELRERLAEYTMVNDAGRRYRLVTPWRAVSDATLWAPASEPPPPQAG
jgi:hypothetical protein